MLATQSSPIAGSKLDEEAQGAEARLEKKLAEAIEISQKVFKKRIKVAIELQSQQDCADILKHSRSA